ncbi:MAG: NAD-dependent epimerase/dehydratase family protein [Hyphomonadaceae bacterium]|nr:NAD-dependent epimerase/dehydratase family protein [Hyphomonadaceae bacterium]
MSKLVLVTGISGFIGAHVAASLLRQGYRVRGTVRSRAKADAVSAALGRAGLDVAQIEFVEADLTHDAGWAEAAQGCDYVQHVASPFPIRQPRDREALTPAARDGALRVIRASAAAERIVMTSSMVAMMYRARRPARMIVGENDWTDPEWAVLSPYIVSKTRAERAVWQELEASVAKQRLVTINPGFVLGPALTRDTNTSLQVIEMMLAGAYPAMPPVHFPVVDVRDLADLHVAAMTAPEAGGRRLIGAGETLSMQDMARILKEALPAKAKKVPTGALPAFAVRLLANFDPAVRTILADLGTTPIADAAYTTSLTGIRFRPARESVVAAAQSLAA